MCWTRDRQVVSTSWVFFTSHYATTSVRMMFRAHCSSCRNGKALHEDTWQSLLCVRSLVTKLEESRSKAIVWMTTWPSIIALTSELTKIHSSLWQLSGRNLWAWFVTGRFCEWRFVCKTERNLHEIWTKLNGNKKNSRTQLWPCKRNQYSKRILTVHFQIHRLLDGRT